MENDGTWFFFSLTGTAVLQIGTASASPRTLTVCDGGLYTCVAISPEGGVHKRNFSLLIGCEFIT